MKIKSFVFSLILLSSFSFRLYTKETNPLKYSISTDFAYYPKSDYIAGDTHFAPLTGIFSGLEGRVKGDMDYKISTPLGEHWLLADANLVLGASFELTPVSVKPGVSIEFTPLPFLVFSTGAAIGTGWNLAGMQGLAYLTTDDEGKLTYNDYTPFNNWFVKWYAQGTFQFDTGAIVAGDWTHVQFMYTYQIYYERLTNTDNGDIWMWQCTKNKVNGWSNYQNIILAYQMPLVLSRVGILTEINGHYSDSDFPRKEYKGSFKTIAISPLAQFTIGKHDSLSAILGFSSRRSFEEEHEESIVAPTLTYAGREWFFNRLALSWTHTF